MYTSNDRKTMFQTALKHGLKIYNHKIITSASNTR